MKIVHICATFTNGLSYQENILTKFHKKMGFEVIVITSKWIYNNKGELIKEDNNENDIKSDIEIIRLNIKDNRTIKYKFIKYLNFFETLDKIVPDIIFLHGCQWSFMSDIIKYKKKYPFSRLFIDNHADYSNSATNWFSKNILHKIIWKYYVQKIEKYTEVFFGVMPSRVKILTELYGIPKERCELLLMGADDEYINVSEKRKIDLKEKYKITDKDFVIITGGKIDLAKKQTLDLIRIVKELNKILLNKLKLVIFGSVIKELKKEFDFLCKDDKNIIYIGWVSSRDVYEYIATSNLAVYPGRHSVLWEQTVAQGIPLVVKYWEGTTHIDIKGNVKFLYEDNSKELKKILKEILLDSNKYEEMKKNALKKEREEFFYSNIAKKSIKIKRKVKNND